MPTMYTWSRGHESGFGARREIGVAKRGCIRLDKYARSHESGIGAILHHFGAFSKPGGVGTWAQGSGSVDHSMPARRPRNVRTA